VIHWPLILNSEKMQGMSAEDPRVNKILDILMDYIRQDFSNEIPLSNKGDELDAIAAGLNTLAEEMKASLEERKKYESRIKKMNEGLEAVNKELEAFSYSVSHDLRAPLRAVNGYVQILKEEYGGKLDEEGQRMIDIISYNATKMGTLIDDLLAFSQLGRKEIQKKEVDMNELAEGVLLDLNKLITHRAAIQIDKLPAIKADYGLVHQALFNLVSNAIKYSSHSVQPVIQISAQENEREVTFWVKDNGAGFDMRFAHKLFGVFQRLHSSEEFEGTGVGLAIVQRIISRHGGRVWAEGEVNHGATFYFTLNK